MEEIFYVYRGHDFEILKHFSNFERDSIADVMVKPPPAAAAARITVSCDVLMFSTLRESP